MDNLENCLLNFLFKSGATVEPPLRNMKSQNSDKSSPTNSEFPESKSSGGVKMLEEDKFLNGPQCLAKIFIDNGWSINTG